MSDTASTDTGKTDAPHGAEENGQTTETPSVEDLLAQVEEWKGHARKHEQRAKDNKDAADALEALKREKMTDAERAQVEAQERDSRLTEAEARAEKAEAALARFQIAAEFGLDKEDTEALAAVSDPEAVKALAARLAGRSAQRPTPGQGRTKEAPRTPKSAFVDALTDLIQQ